MSEETIEFFKRSRELIDYSHSMQMATNYKSKGFNYGHYGALLMKALKEMGNEDEIKRIYPKGLC
ncbi:hypothetical protein [Clostridium sp.]|uniref:hypothetical protein n=1 Tax=Clostridium sp. TaxID=1506 RepID=UPI0026220557|nr:hypothetical protein [Clostridium sp.]